MFWASFWAIIGADFWAKDILLNCHPARAGASVARARGGRHVRVVVQAEHGQPEEHEVGLPGEHPDMMSASEGSWKRGRSKGSCVNFKI